MCLCAHASACVMCTFVCACQVHTCHSARVVIRRQPLVSVSVSVLIFHLVCCRVFLTFHLSRGAKDNKCALPSSGFTWVLGIETQVLMLDSKVSPPTWRLPSPCLVCLLGSWRIKLRTSITLPLELYFETQLFKLLINTEKFLNRLYVLFRSSDDL